MPFAVTIAAWVTYRPDARLTWLMALPFFALATMFTLNFDAIHLVAWYGGEELPLRYRFAATWAAREADSTLGSLDGIVIDHLEKSSFWGKRRNSPFETKIDEWVCIISVTGRLDTRAIQASKWSRAWS